MYAILLFAFENAYEIGTGTYRVTFSECHYFNLLDIWNRKKKHRKRNQQVDVCNAFSEVCVFPSQKSSVWVSYIYRYLQRTHHFCRYTLSGAKLQRSKMPLNIPGSRLHPTCTTKGKLYCHVCPQQVQIRIVFFLIFLPTLLTYSLTRIASVVSFFQLIYIYYFDM